MPQIDADADLATSVAAVLQAGATTAAVVRDGRVVGFFDVADIVAPEPQRPARGRRGVIATWVYSATRRRARPSLYGVFALAARLLEEPGRCVSCSLRFVDVARGGDARAGLVVSDLAHLVR